MNRFLSGAAGAIVAAAWLNVAHAGLEPLTISRILELEASITASHARTFAYDGDWRDSERSLVDDSKAPIGRAPGGFVQAFGTPDGDLVRFGWVSPVAGKYARGQGTLILRLLSAARIEEVLSDSALVWFTSGGRPIEVGSLLEPGVHRFAWTLTGPAPSERFGGGFRLAAASSSVPLPGAAPAAALLLGAGLRRRRRAA